MSRTGKIRILRQQTMQMSVRRRIVIGSSIIAILTAGITVFLNLSNNENVYAAGSGSAIVDGSWNNPSTWSFAGVNRVPTCGDTITIPLGRTVTIDNQENLYGCGSSVIINVYGLLQFTHGNKIDLPCNSFVFIYPTGVVKKTTAGGGSSTLITICSTTLWTAGDGPLPGPDTLFVPPPSGGSTLPVKLIYFKAKLDDQNVKFEWATAAEINNEFFTVEKSNDGEHFEALLNQPGAGNSTSNLYYNAHDNSPYNGFSYYRLKQTDYDGHYTYSNIETIRNGEKNEDATEAIEIKSTTPNPFNESFKLSFMTKSNSKIDISLMSISGQLITEEKFQSESGYNTWEFIDKYNLKKGIYFVILSYNNQKFTKKIVRN